MRFAAFVFSFILIFSNVSYAYIAPLFQIVARGGLLARTTKGAVKIAKENKRGILSFLFTLGSSGYCAKNKKICQEIFGESWDILEDMLGVDDDDNVDGQCTSPKIYYRAGNYQGYDKKSAINDAIDKDFKAKYRNNSSVNYELIGYKSDDMNRIQSLFDDKSAKIDKKSHINLAKRNVNKKSSFKDFISMNQVTYTVKAKYSNGNTSTFDARASFAVDLALDCYADKIPDDEKDEQIKQIINQTINNKSETEINNIIEKHITEIEINNYCSNGGKCDELSKEFANEVFKKLDKYDIDKIDRDNCEVKNNKIVSCRNARIDKDSDDDNQTQKEKSDEDKTINCDATGFHKKVCDFIDWYQDDDLDDNTKIDVKDDAPEPTNANIDFKATCPPPYEVNISLYGIDINFTLLDTPEVCSFLHAWIKPIMLVIAPLQAIYILGGRND